jgi:hypothetical protein
VKECLPCNPDPDPELESYTRGRDPDPVQASSLNLMGTQEKKTKLKIIIKVGENESVQHRTKRHNVNQDETIAIYYIFILPMFGAVYLI